MECTTPGAVRDEELLAYLAGEPVRPFVVQHLAQCQRCSSLLATYRRLEHVLSSKLYRQDCPPSQVLGEYQLGLLSKEMTAAVQNHLSICRFCAAEVTMLADFLANDPMLEARAVVPGGAARFPASQNYPVGQRAREVIERIRDQSSAGVRRIVATLVPPQPRLAFQRNSIATSTWPRRYTAGDVSISLQVEQDTTRRDLLQLAGFVKRSGQALEALEGTKVLLSTEQEASSRGNTYSQTIDELGNFLFSSVVPATYTLELQFPESIVVIEQLPITPQD